MECITYDLISYYHSYAIINALLLKKDQRTSKPVSFIKKIRLPVFIGFYLRNKQQ